MRRMLPFGILAVAACGGASPATGAERHLTVTEAALDSLPELTVHDGTLLCTALGYDDCPLHTAVANRLDDRRIAIWEPGRTVRIWRAGDSAGLALGRSGGDSSQYEMATAVATDGSGYLVVTPDSGWRLLRYDRDGNLGRTDLLHVDQQMTVLGFVGDRPVRQSVDGWDGDSAATLTVTALRRITDTSGTDLLTIPVNWMHGGSELAPPLAPLIAASPSWGLEDDGGIVWSPGGPFRVERRSPRGTVRWTLDGPPGLPVTARDLDIRDSVARAQAALLPLVDADFVSMRERSDSLHPAISGLTVMPDGRVLLARSVLPGRDSVDYVRLDSEGQPQSRFRLPEGTRVLLAEGDSLLVHRPTESEPWQLRWLRLEAP